MIRAFNIRIHTLGNAPTVNTRGIIFVANHISWVDIHVLNSHVPLRFIAKSEIKSWPIFGYLVSKADTLFIERNRRQNAGKIVEATVDSLRNGDNLCFFPEGTTSDGASVLPFKGSVLQAAIDIQAQVWPVMIHYPSICEGINEGGVNSQMAYAGETSLIESIQKILALAEPIVLVHFLTPIQASDQSRRDLTQAVFSMISRAKSEALERP